MNRPDAPNTGKIDRQLAHLKRVRATPAGLPVGWGPDEIPPPAANAFVKAGLCVIDAAAKPKPLVKPVPRT